MIPFPGMLTFDETGANQLKPEGPDYIDVKVQLFYEEVVYIFGPRCPNYERGCVVCKAWRQFDKGNKVDVTVDRAAFIEALVNGDV